MFDVGRALFGYCRVSDVGCEPVGEFGPDVSIFFLFWRCKVYGLSGVRILGGVLMLGAGGFCCLKIQSGGKDNGNISRLFVAQVGPIRAVHRSRSLKITCRCCCWFLR